MTARARRERQGEGRRRQPETWRARIFGPVNRLFRGRFGRAARWFAGGMAVITVCVVGLYVAILSGVLSIDLATPWIVTALEEKLPPGYRVQIARTRLDYDSSGAPVLTAETIVIRNEQGEEVARAPRAEVGLEAGSLLIGYYRARRINLINATMTVRLDDQGNVRVAPPAQTTVTPPPAAAPEPPPAPVVAPTEAFRFPRLAAWLDRLERTGLDGIALAEVALERGTLIVQSDTPGRTWRFVNINTSVRRPSEGGVAFRLSSGEGARPWELTATIGAVVGGVRAVDIVADRVVPNDLLYAVGFGDSGIHADTPLSGILRGQIASDGKLVSGSMRAALARGEIGDTRDARGRFQIDEVLLQMRFDPDRRAILIEPLQIAGGRNRIAFAAIVEAPPAGSTIWPVVVPRGLISLSTGKPNEPSLSLDRVTMRGGFDPQKLRFTIDEGVLQGMTAGIALSGALDLGADTPSLQLGIAGNRMPVSALKRLWPAPVAPGPRAWVLQNVDSGVVERMTLGLNLPLELIGRPGTLPDDALKLEIDVSGGVFTPVAGLPPISDAKATILVTGRSTRIRVAEGVLELAGKRRITISEGSFEVPQHMPKSSPAVIQLRAEGNGEAFADLLAREFFRAEAGVKIDADSTRGSVGANVRIELPLKDSLQRNEVGYTVAATVKNFTADDLVRGQRVDNANALITVDGDQIHIKGEGRIAGAPATFEFRRAKGKPDGDFKIAATLDDAARMRFGIDLGPMLTGPVPVKVNGTVNDRETRADIDADLTRATIADLVPGWNKAAGRPARAIYRFVERGKTIWLEDVNISGSGVLIRGTFELDSDGDLEGANLTTFQLSEGDRATLKADRGNDGALKVIVRGTVLDARGMLRALADAPGRTGAKKKLADIDLDLRLAAATGHNGEVIRNLELRVVRRNAEIRSFALIGRIGRDSSIVGELRARDGGTPVIYITSGDAGALFRFADYYGKIQGGEVWIVLDTPNARAEPQEGIVSVRNFTISGEPSLDRLQAQVPDGADRTAPQVQRQPRGAPTPFLRLRIDFTRTPGRFAIKEALIFGPTIGATVDGVLDYGRNNVHLRGTYVPAYGLNNFFGQIPVVGLFLGGPKEGLLALTFEVVGPVSGPTLRVNPMSMAAPGFFRKIFEFRGAQDTPPPNVRGNN